jgi:hypothetical protein
METGENQSAFDVFGRFFAPNPRFSPIWVAVSAIRYGLCGKCHGNYCCFSTRLSESSQLHRHRLVDAHERLSLLSVPSRTIFRSGDKKT